MDTNLHVAACRYADSKTEDTLENWAFSWIHYYNQFIASILERSIQCRSQTN